MLKIIFFGAGQFGVPALQKLAAAHQIVKVFCPPPRPSGRKMRPVSVPLAEAARALSLPLAETEAAAANAEAVRLSADAIIACDYGALLPSAVCDSARLGAFNIHPSLLPRWRGAAPVWRAMLAGDEKTGVTIIKMGEELDAGDILTQQTILISPAMTGGALHEILAEAGASLLLKTLRDNPPPIPQNPQLATYAKKISAADRTLDFTAAADILARQVRAFAPAPGAFAFLDGARVKIFAAETAESAAETNAPPGAVLSAGRGGIAVACGRGVLALFCLQREGRRALGAEEFARGYAAFPRAFAANPA
ncbi:MAG: methionyl-tRNA formyltransferase [Gammaproteobacteria bacterium]